MSSRTRTWVHRWIRVSVLLALLLSSSGTLAPEALASGIPASKPTFRSGRLDLAVVAESSGLVASRRQNGVFWTHNDSGNKPELFAIDSAGRVLKTFQVAARNTDWEDIATDDQGTLYLADIGNNARDRREVFVHAIAEPAIEKPQAGPAGKGQGALPVTTTWTLRYPNDRPFDAESLCILGGKGYVISKLLNLSQAGLYRFDLDPSRPRQVLELVGALPIRYPVTAADTSADGKWLAVVTVAGPFLFRIDGDVTAALKVPPSRVIYASPKMEAGTLTADGLLTTTEEGDVLLFRWKDFGLP